MLTIMDSGLNSSYFIIADESGVINTYFSIFVEIEAGHSWNYYISIIMITLSVILFCEGLISLISIFTYKKFRTVTNMFVLSNTFIAVLLLPYSVLMYIAARDGQWLSGVSTCKYPIFALLLSSFILVWVNAAIALDRHRQITSPSSPQLRLTSATLVLVLIWVVGSAVTSPYIAVYDVLQVGVNNSWYLICARPSNTLTTILTVVVLTCVIFIPFTVLIVSYVKMFNEIQRISRQLKQHRTLFEATVPRLQRTTQDSPSSLTEKEKRNKRYKRLTIILVSLVILFVVLWLPLAILFAAVPLDQRTETYRLRSYHVSLSVCGVLLNGCVAPLFYSLTDANIRRHLFKRYRSPKHLNETAVTNA